ncbi:type II toxin-antitoxin system RnlB family antitoxin [Anaerosalibacter sp. Marseille-P3206]|uniref:type II toxin-antitoxin system RnlB family antitoxin n=1 Tax=Anaerosalibacter sp. Marseille-P3206 TaxID=1871005 RepID=UPI000985C7DA|nr:type II toxin-antitoxin system RnlB family antitoxin [Anaerosalibacter sp. Marseille-P3206]
MRKYLINNLDIDNFSMIITLLDYETKISDCLKSVRISSFDSKELLVDTALCSGMNGYRFIATTLNNDGTINISDYRYVDVNPLILEKANEIIRHEPISLNNSILTIPQINFLKSKLN